MIRQNSTSLPYKITNLVGGFNSWYQNNRFFQHLKNIFPKESCLSAVATSAFFILSLIIPNNKFFFALTIFYVCIQFLITRSLITTLFYSFIPISIFSIGLTYTFIAVPKTLIFSDQYPSGRVLSFIFSPYIVILLSGIGIFLASLFSKRIPRFNLTLLFLMITVLLIIISAQQSLYFPAYAMIYAFCEFGWISLIILFINHFKSVGVKRRQELFLSLFFHLSLTLLFISSLVFVQLVKRSPLGLTIESTGVAPLFGAAADESTLVFRPMGLSPHANMMASELFILWICLVVIYFSFLNKIRLGRLVNSIFVIATIFSLLAIIFSQCRSVYISTIVFLVLLLVLDYQFISKWIKLTWFRFSRFGFIGFVLVLIGGFVITNRAWYSLYSFTETGGFIIREELNREAISLLKKYPVLGVGKGMFIPALAANNPTGVVSKFPEAVHNGFLLFVVESGVLAQGASLVFLFLLVRNLFYRQISASLKKVMAAGLIAQIIPMFFQPFINYWTVYTIIILILLV